MESKKGVVMKKIALLFAIACAGQMYGMEPEKPDIDPALWGRPSHEEGLPGEIKTLIIMALQESGNNPEEAIKNIIKVSLPQARNFMECCMMNMVT